ncbi:MAG: hypothetical protein WAX38_03620 [Minisyncoccia bacterium]
MVKPELIAHIISEVRRKGGEVADELHLAELIEAGFLKLKHENEKKYLELIHELSEQLEILAKEMGRVRNQHTHA